MALRRLAALLVVFSWFGAAEAQAPGGPPAVGVVRVTRQTVTETSEFIGRIQAVDRVALTARVTAFLEQRLFVEGAEVKEGDLLYRLERPPFEAAVAQQEAAVADASARLANANIQLARAQSLLNTAARSAAPISAWAMSCRRVPVPSPASLARTLCTCCSRSRSAPKSIWRSAIAIRAA